MKVAGWQGCVKNKSKMDTKFKIFFVTLMCVFGFASCSDDDNTATTPLDTPVLAGDGATVSSLSFHWDAVEGATQYAYELKDPEGAVALGGVTTSTSLIATGLKDNTTYTLTVWAYAAIGSQLGTSPIATLTATTEEIVPLEVPDPAFEEGRGSVTISWPAVENAASYYYYYEVNGEKVEGTTTDNSVTLTGLPSGTYTFHVKALSGSEEYSDSEEISITFTCTQKTELWRRKGTYTSAILGTSYSASLVAYSDGTYAIEKFYGVDGYDLEFYVDDATGALVFTNQYESDEYYDYVYSGLEGGMSSLYIYMPSAGYSNFTGNRDSGSLYLYVYSYDNFDNTLQGYDEFTWEETDELWRRSGTYESAVTGETYKADIVANADGSYTIEGFYGVDGYDLTFTVDEATSEINITNGISYDGYDPYVETGLSSDVSPFWYIYYYTTGGYSSFEGNNVSGGVWFWAGSYDDAGEYVGDYDYFTWSGGTVGSSYVKKKTPSLPGSRPAPARTAPARPRR